MLIEAGGSRCATFKLYLEATEKESERDEKKHKNTPKQTPGLRRKGPSP